MLLHFSGHKNYISWAYIKKQIKILIFPFLFGVVPRFAPFVPIDIDA
jgi:hypothetical protein